MGARGDLPRWAKLPHMNNNPETRSAYGWMAITPTLCIRLVSGYFRQFTSAYLRLEKAGKAEVSGSNFILPPPFTSASYLRLPPPQKTAKGGSKRK